jgi:hypothetical protein
MSLYPGAPRLDQGEYVLNDAALAQSMAKAIEDAMDEVSWLVKGQHLPAAGRDDRRLLFVAISRGVLKYLRDHQVAINATTSAGQASHTHGVDLNVTMNAHTSHP